MRKPGWNALLLRVSPHCSILEETTMIEQFIDNFVRKSDVFSAPKRANVTRMLIDIMERSFLMREAA
jgi:hypothetical protein